MLITEKVEQGVVANISNGMANNEIVGLATIELDVRKAYKLEVNKLPMNELLNYMIENNLVHQYKQAADIAREIIAIDKHINVRDTFTMSNADVRDAMQNLSENEVLIALLDTDFTADELRQTALQFVVNHRAANPEFVHDVVKEAREMNTDKELSPMAQKQLNKVKEKREEPDIGR